MIIALKLWLLFVVAVVSVYAARHLLFAFVRLYLPQRHAFQDVAGAYMPPVCIMVPMHNEAAVVRDTVACLKRIDYPRDRLEIIIINDHSTDETGRLLDELCAGSPEFRVVHRNGNGGHGGKPAALNAALPMTRADAIVTFDADYWASRDSVMRLVAPMIDPRVALTMGRVVPRNCATTFLTRMLDLERAGAYQVDQQARHTLGLLPQYGGTVGAIRRSFLLSVGGWDENYLAEDTHLTVLAFIHGLRVVYCNLEETTEEAPAQWRVRQKQLRRWVIGHNQVAHRLGPLLLNSPFLTGWQRGEGFLLLSIYASTFLLVTGYIVSIILLLMGEGLFASTALAIIILTTYSTLGNAASFIEVAVSSFIDGRPHTLWGIPLLILHFAGSVMVVAESTLEWAWREVRGQRRLAWQKTARNGG